MSWSPDGTRLLYTDDRKLLPDRRERQRTPAEWTPAASRPARAIANAAFSSDGTHPGLRAKLDRRVRVLGSRGHRDHGPGRRRGMELSSTAPAGGMFPRWSPDGTQIVFWRLGDKDTGGPVAPTLAAVFVVDADGQNLHQVTPTTLAAQSAGWSPDGSRIVFTSPDWRVPERSSLHSSSRRDRSAPVDDGRDLQLGDLDAGRAAPLRPGSRFFPNGGALGFWTMDADGSNAARSSPGCWPETRTPSGRRGQSGSRSEDQPSCLRHGPPRRRHRSGRHRPRRPRRRPRTCRPGSAGPAR